MPRYYFHLADGDREIDRDGTELPDVRAALDHAAMYIGGVLAEEPDRLRRDGHMRVEVTDEDGARLFAIHINYSADIFAPANLID